MFRQQSAQALIFPCLDHFTFQSHHQLIPHRHYCSETQKGSCHMPAENAALASHGADSWLQQHWGPGPTSHPVRSRTQSLRLCPEGPASFLSSWTPPCRSPPRGTYSPPRPKSCGISGNWTPWAHYHPPPPVHTAPATLGTLLCGTGYLREGWWSCCFSYRTVSFWKPMVCVTST